ncbi:MULTISPECIES: chaperone modulator CbpM [unclassified Pseudodesulfovibrio]|uniref:chaperone modulator CbpM n=1 Tax=unclassified Pseudodesulfovibrio TaxID=2661612 RepID=UPI000FEB814F|nr:MULTISPECIES: chaperone modulator CbpM [unclassified Pseudodesulfovibrio]MCJ2162972.1 chaperone modulator CbpM [Pseudodesulfovibrio sp. S3-i]RWU06970.1 MerR family transcriptional regulator [Pseudodesulfovibrio sp. S3]
MTTRKLQEMLMHLPGLNLPERSEYVAWAQLVQLTSIQPADVAELVDLGWISPKKTSAEEYLFRLRDVYRIHKLMRLVNDLDVNFNSGSIIVDLLERVEELETEVEELKRLV